MEKSEMKSWLKEELVLPIKNNINLYTEQLLAINQLPLILTNADLKREFQVSDSTLNRIVKLGDFPTCWFGIRGHYSKEEVLDWLKKMIQPNFEKRCPCFAHCDILFKEKIWYTIW